MVQSIGRRLAGANLQWCLWRWSFCATWTRFWEMLVLVDGELGKEQEDSLVVVCGDSGCELAVWELLGIGCGSLRLIECLWFTLVCFNWNKQIWVSHIQFKISPVSSRDVMSRWWSPWNGLHTAHWVVLKPGLLGLSAWLYPETKVWDVLHCLTFVLVLLETVAERTVFELCTMLWLTNCFSVYLPFKTSVKPVVVLKGPSFPASKKCASIVYLGSLAWCVISSSSDWHQWLPPVCHSSYHSYQYLEWNNQSIYLVVLSHSTFYPTLTALPSLLYDFGHEPESPSAIAPVMRI